MANIFQINQEYLHIASTLEENGGEINEELENQLSINRENLENKAIGYCFVTKQLDSDIETIDKEIARLQAIKKSKVNTVSRLKETIKHAMLLHGIDSVKGDLISISFRKSPDSVIIENEDLIQDAYKVEQPKKIDKKSISDALKKGIDVPGASLKTDGKSLIIK